MAYSRRSLATTIYCSRPSMFFALFDVAGFGPKSFCKRKEREQISNFVIFRVLPYA
jgi:hypothetical protein